MTDSCGKDDEKCDCCCTPMSCTDEGCVKRNIRNVIIIGLALAAVIAVSYFLM